MRNLIAIAAMLAFVACGNGASHEVAPLPGRPSATILPDGPCTNTPEDCGTKVCVDCTAEAPPGTTAACVAGRCAFSCAEGFHKCGTHCVPTDDVGNCGPACLACTPPPNSTPICASDACDFACVRGFVRSGAGCASLSFSTSY